MTLDSGRPNTISVWPVSPGTCSATCSFDVIAHAWPEQTPIRSAGSTPRYQRGVPVPPTLVNEVDDTLLDFLVVITAQLNAISACDLTPQGR